MINSYIEGVKGFNLTINQTDITNKLKGYVPEITAQYGPDVKIKLNVSGHSDTGLVSMNTY